MRSRTRNISGIDMIIIVGMVAFCFATIYPFLYCLAYSLSNKLMVMTRNITFFPIGFTLDSYKVVFKNKLIYNSLCITVLRTFFGTVAGLVVTGLAAYAISKRKLPGKRMISIILIIPMYLSGGLIPYYVLITKLHLVNNFLVYILPHTFYAFNMIIMRTFFDTIPESLEESVKLDGGGDFTIFTKIIIPLSMPIIATMAMFLGVWQWNSWFDGMLFINNQYLLPMQTVLQRLLLENFSAQLSAEAFASLGSRRTTPESLKMATLIVSTIPIVCVYPFFQKYFIKGIMIGAVKA